MMACIVIAFVLLVGTMLLVGIVDCIMQICYTELKKHLHNRNMRLRSKGLN
jgi:hypothetical protein